VSFSANEWDVSADLTPLDVVEGYLSVGMNDYLPKPFNRIELFQMLQKHLHHMLTNFRRMSQEIPPAVGVPPLSENGLQEAIATGVASLRQDSWDLNGNLIPMARPVAAMGISGDQYTGLVQNYYFSNSPATPTLA
jgi:osomolarity two-component system, response regulator SKN7